MRKLSPERQAVVAEELKHRLLYSNRAMCRRHGISLATLKRLESETLDPYAEGLRRARERQLSQMGSDTVRVLLLNGNEPQQKPQQKVKAA